MFTVIVVVVLFSTRFHVLLRNVTTCRGRFVRLSHGDAVQTERLALSSSLSFSKRLDLGVQILVQIVETSVCLDVGETEGWLFTLPMAVWHPLSGRYCSTLHGRGERNVLLLHKEAGRAGTALWRPTAVFCPLFQLQLHS